MHRHALPGMRPCPLPPTPERLLLTRVLTAAVLVAALLAACFFLDQKSFDLLVALLAGLAAYEWSALHRAGKPASGAYAAACMLLYYAVLQYSALIGGVMWVATAFWLLAAP